jgi:hypothetical protein
VQAICDYTGDHKSEDRIRTARDAVERHAEGGTTYGLPKLSEELGEDIAKALRRILDLPKEEALRSEPTTQRDRAIETLAGIEFWCDEAGEAYATLQVAEHYENVRIGSRRFNGSGLPRLACGMRH